MATYKQVQDFIREKEGFTVKTCWIADVKEQCGLNPKASPNRVSCTTRQNPCPPEKVEVIKDALRNFNMIKLI
jgi:hypothetical protein